MQEVRILSKDCHKKKKKENKKKKIGLKVESLISCYSRHAEDEFIFEFIDRRNH